MSSHPTTLTLVLRQRPRLRGAWPNTCQPAHLERPEQSASLPQVPCAAPGTVSSPRIRGGCREHPKTLTTFTVFCIFSYLCKTHRHHTRERRRAATNSTNSVRFGSVRGKRGREERCGGGCYCFGNSRCSSAALPSPFPPMSVV